MATYAIGDVQGCFTELNSLLTHINFDPRKDFLWFCGDLVNRGPNSIAVLRFIRDLGDRAITVLGNHDLHLLAIAFANGRLHRKDTMQDILDAPDSLEVLHWLRLQPLFHHDQTLGYSMVHAGLAPQWCIESAAQFAAEVESALRGQDYETYLSHIYGNEPAKWQESLTGQARLRCITNFFTRIRFCDVQGEMNFEDKGAPTQAPGDDDSTNLLPWYNVPSRKSRGHKIIFGHWSTHYLTYPDITAPEIRNEQIYPLDTGCLWGGFLTALRLEDESVFQVPASHR